MANIIAQVTNFDVAITPIGGAQDPGPNASYTTSIHNSIVNSPYYNDGRTVPTFDYVVSSEPIDNIDPVATTEVAGPAATVQFALTGAWQDPTTLTVGIDVTGGTPISEVVEFSATAVGPDEAAAQVAAYLASVVDPAEVSVSVGTTSVALSAEGVVSALTITSLVVG